MISCVYKLYKLDRYSVIGVFFYYVVKRLYYGKSFFKKILIFICRELKNFYGIKLKIKNLDCGDKLFNVLFFFSFKSLVIY